MEELLIDATLRSVIYIGILLFFVSTGWYLVTKNKIVFVIVKDDKINLEMVKDEK